MSLTFAEHQQVLASLRRRFPKAKHPSLVSVGLGLALAGGTPDTARGTSVCFYVRGKHTPRQVARRLPDAVTFRFRRRGKWESVTLPTDVIEVGGVRTTGGLLGVTTPSGNADVCTAGVLAEWKEGQVVQSGLMTVAHAVGDDTGVTVGGNVVGGVAARMPESSRVDLCVIRFTDRATFATAAGPPRAVVPPMLRLDQLGLPDPRPGLSFPPGGAGSEIPFRTAGYCAELDFDNDGELLSLRHLIRVFSDTPGAFMRGRSGSAWQVRVTDAAGTESEHLLAVQVGGDERNGFQTGYGQLLCEIPEEPIVSNALSRLRGQIGGSVIRVVGYS